MIFYILHNREGMAEYAHAVVLAHVLWAGQSASGVCVPCGNMSASMETDTSEDEFPGRWRDIQKLLTRGSPLAHPEFEPSEQVLTCKCYGQV